MVPPPPAAAGGQLSRMWEWGAMMGVAAQSWWDDTSVDTPCHLFNDMPKSWGKITVYGIDNTDISECILIYQKY